MLVPPLVIVTTAHLGKDDHLCLAFAIKVQHGFACACSPLQRAWHLCNALQPLVHKQQFEKGMLYTSDVADHMHNSLQREMHPPLNIWDHEAVTPSAAACWLQQSATLNQWNVAAVPGRLGTR